MAGYIVELYKNIISDENYWTGQSISDSELKNKVYITFGEFDKMTISRTNDFSRMRDVSKMSREWVGDRQKILLFELAENNQLEYREKGECSGFYVNNSARSEKLFLGITILQFKESQDESEKDIKESLNICRKNILKIIKTEQSPVECSVFGLLGTYGVAIIWAADQFTDILKMINCIKGTNVLSDDALPDYKFISAFTILAKNKDGKSEGKLENLKGTALLQITLQTNINQSVLNKIKEAIPETEKFHTVGEYDLMIKTPIKNIYNLFEKENILDPSSKFYTHYILQTNVKLCEAIGKDYVSNIKEKKKGEEKGEEENEGGKPANPDSRFPVENIKEKYIKLRELFFDKFPKTAGMVDSLDLLYGDYNSKIASVSNKMWAEDYSQQFLTILQLLEKSLETNNITTSNLLKDIQDILNCFEYQTIHISESNNLLLETPKCHLRYTGRNNLILYAYFGILKELIELAYRMQRESQQSKIIPLISVDTVPIIKSILFMDYTTPFEDRLVEFNFPMMALYALPFYAPYLQHEVFHYAAPKDRVIRNWAKGCILAICAMKNIVCSLFYSLNNNEDSKMIDNMVEGVLGNEIYRAVVNKYSDPLISQVNNTSSKVCNQAEINGKCQSWIQYEKQLFEQLEGAISNHNTMVLEDNLLYEVLHELYCSKTEIQKNCHVVFSQETALDETKRNKMNRLVNHFLTNTLEGIFGNNNRNDSMLAFQELLKDTRMTPEQLLEINELIQLSDALKEVVCDLPMIELSKLDAVAYLITYVNIQNDLLKQNDSEVQIQHCIRIGIILDNFWNWDIHNEDGQNKLESLKFDFICSYVGLCFSSKKSLQDSNVKDYLKGIVADGEKWFDKIKEWYRRYLIRYRIFSGFLQIILKQSSVAERLKKEDYELADNFKRLKVSDYYTLVRVYGTEILSAINDDTSESGEIKEKIAAARESFQKEVFGFNIDIILSYQKQKSFEELGNICQSYFKKEAPYVFPTELWAKIATTSNGILRSTNDKKAQIQSCVYKVKNIEELFQTVQKIAAHLEKVSREHYGNKDDALWYRGHQDSAYLLLPTAMRRYTQHADTEKCLRNYQRGAYDEFKFRVDNASEKIDKTGYTECDYLALMQHYGAPTIYMDWTENAISALYFALEAFIDPAKEKNQDEKDAVLYILHPNLYNEARNQMMDEVSITSGRNLDRLMLKSKLRSAGSLPNLSVSYRSEDFGMFLLGNLENEDDMYDTPPEKINSLSLMKAPENILYLPLAIYASRANVRVRAQSGMFMAFNIFTHPSDGKEFEYMALGKIQEFYLKYFQNTTPFLYSIVIDGTKKKEIAGWLKAIGVTKDMVYPELSNIAERIL